MNPVPAVFLPLAGPLVRLCGREPGTGYGWFTREWLVGGNWPLALAPLHWANYRLLGWDTWAYLLMAFAAGVALAFVVLIARSSPRARAGR